MTCALRISQTFFNYDLRSVFYGSTLGRYDLDHLGLSRRATWLLQAILPLYRLGAGLLCVNLSELSDTAARVAGYGYSLRTTRSALADLESAGYVYRRNYRHGGPLRVVLLDSLAELLARDKLERTVKKPRTLSHQQLHRQEFPARRQKGTDQDHTIPLPVVCSSKLQSETRARVVEAPPSLEVVSSDCEKKTEPRPEKPRHKFSPLVYSLRCVCDGRYRAILTAIAEREIATGEAKSGIDWEFWSDRWNSMSIHQRESHACREILPVLLEHLRNPHPMHWARGQRESLEPATARVCEDADRENISARIRESLRSAAAVQVQQLEKTVEYEIDPILAAAAARARRRAADLERWEAESD
jgi:hypothetical protein